MASRLCPPESSTTRLSRERRRLFFAHALSLGLRYGFSDARLDRRLFQRVILWDWVGDEEPAGTDLALKPFVRARS